MVRLIMAFSIITFSAFGQDVYLNDGIIKASATITPSEMLATDQSNFYFSGFLEYHMTKSTSFRGEAFMFVDSRKAEGGLRPLNGGMRVFTSGNYHWNKGNFDYALGAGPGLSILRLLNGDPNAVYVTSPYEVKYIPSFIVQTGVTYYVWKYFHFFANVSYVATPATHMYSGPVKRIHNLDEIMFSAGLGFQLPTKK